MANRIRDYTGQRIGRLTVINIAGRNKRGQVRFNCVCDCGKKIVVDGGDLGRKRIMKSCGCYKKNRVDPNRKSRYCPRCKIEKPINEFPQWKTAHGGTGSYCRLCQRKRNREDAPRRKVYNKVYDKRRSKNDVGFRIIKALRCRVYHAIRKGSKCQSTLLLLGCTIEQLRTHLERQFQPGMTWENYGVKGWHIDHIRPCSSFDLRDPQQQCACFHYTNLQPLWAKDNWVKHNRLPQDGLSILGGSGFIGSHYALQYPNCCIEPRNTDAPTRKDVLYFVSTTTNYNIFTDLKLDINTNLSKLMYVLPHVNGVFNYISTWFVWGKSGVGSTCETAAREIDPCKPSGFYSITKLAAEQLVQTQVYTRGINGIEGPSAYRILRLCNVIGNDPKADKRKNALEWMLRKIVNGDDIEVYDGDNFRNYLHIDDVCRGINLVLTKGELNATYSIGARESVRLMDIVSYAIEKTGSKSQVTRIPAPVFHKIVQVENFHMDTQKLQSLGFKPEMDAFQAVDKVLEGIYLTNSWAEAVKSVLDPSELDTFRGLTLVDKGDTVAGHYLIGHECVNSPTTEYWTANGWKPYGEVFMSRAEAVEKRREILAAS